MGEAVTIFRIENANGIGPYAIDDWVGNKNIPYDPPAPHAEDLPFIKGKSHCGFSSMEKLRMWFNQREHFLWLTANGFVLRELEVDPQEDELFAVGSWQVVFDRALAKVVSEVSLV